MTDQRIIFREHGGPEVLEFENFEVSQPKANEVTVRMTAIGLNFIDTYQRSGLYPMSLPSGAGSEGSGIVEAVGSDVQHLNIGDRVAFCGGALGAYATRMTRPAQSVVKLPDDISDEDAAAVMLKGLTVQYLIRQIYPVRSGETVLFHAIAGGVGTIATQWLKALGVTIIGTAGSSEKAELAKSLGCDHVILYRDEDIAERVGEITNGDKVPVVFDSVGKDTFEASLNCLKPRGLMISYGNASGAVTGVNLGILAAKGSLMVTRPTLATFTSTPEALQHAADDLFSFMRDGHIKTQIRQRYSLKDAQQAHIDLESRQTTGQTLIIP
ncbi:MAG: quinone oxidoreductase [Alphaproteobacteria bacterium]|nr:quinone oxidoreductase [Alphaproteobacteria bacterium]